MKLKTKIILISFLAVFSAVLISDAVIWKISRDSLLEEAMQSAYTESYEIFVHFAEYIDGLSEGANEITVNYFFKQNHDDYTICGKLSGNTVTEIYNHTVFRLEDLIIKEKEQKTNTIEYFRTEWNGHKILCFANDAGKSLVLYHVVDISNVYRKLWMLAAGMAAILAAVVLAAGSVLKILLSGALRPLGTLSETARQIAEGHYEKRVPVMAEDEIGALAAQFNKMAEAVEIHTTELKESERRKNLFMGNLTHELKTPMTAISGYAQTMRRIRLSEEDEAEALDYIYKECSRLERLSRKMMRLLELDYSEELKLEEFPVKKLFQSVTKVCNLSAAACGVSLVTAGQRGVLYADFDLMCDAMINLIDNAVKASRPESEVRIYTEPDEPDSFAIVVEDFGCGMTPEETRQIFEPFYMADKSRSRRNGGAGLGLTLTALILRNHRMTLTVESEIGHGTKMRIHVPAETKPDENLQFD